MTLLYSIKKTNWESGEEFYTLVKKNSMYLLEYPTLYAMCVLRKNGNAANTMAAVMRSIGFLYTWAEEECISLHERFMKGIFLDEVELENLSDYCLQRFDIKDDKTVINIKATKVVVPDDIRKITKIKTIRTVDIPSVQPDTQYNRISYISEYLGWLGIELSRVSVNNHRQSIKDMVDNLKELRPRRTSNNRFNFKSNTEDELESLYRVIKADSNTNPFKTKSNDKTKLNGIRARNELIFVLLRDLGVRVGELCGIKLKDLHLGGNAQVDIFRRPHDKTDPRAERAQVKTQARHLPITNKLAKLINDYVNHHRVKIKGAKQTDFLFISHEASKNDEGSPLSMAMVRKILKQISVVTGIKTTPHTLRHSWNDKFSKIADDEGMSTEREMALRRYLMGWSETSDKPAYYSKRRIKQVADKAMLALQEKTTQGMK